VTGARSASLSRGCARGGGYERPFPWGILRGWRGITGQGWVTVWYGRYGWRIPNGRSLHLWGNIYRRLFEHVVHDAVTMGGVRGSLSKGAQTVSGNVYKAVTSFMQVETLLKRHALPRVNRSSQRIVVSSMLYTTEAESCLSRPLRNSVSPLTVMRFAVRAVRSGRIRIASREFKRPARHVYSARVRTVRLDVETGRRG